MKTIDGRKAEVTHSMRYYNNWITLATEYGHPEAAAHHTKADLRKVPNDGDEVTLLTPTFVHDGAMIWVVATESGDKFLYSEKGLRILDEKVTVMKDELGLQREYREVRRKAKVGEKVRVFGHTLHRLDGIHVVRETRSNGHIHFDGGGRLPGGYVVLEPTDTILVKGERFREVERIADEGEHVVIVKESSDNRFKLGEIYEVVASNKFTYVKHPRGKNVDHGGAYVSSRNYRVLEPLTPAQQTQASEQSDVCELERKSNEQQAQIDGLTENVANLARRLSKAELTLHNVGLDVGLVEDGVSEELRTLTDRVAELERGQAPKACESVVSKTSARDEIIEKAKTDVAELLSRNHYYVSPYGVWFSTENWVYSIAHKCEFIVDRNKRTVVALIRKSYDKEQVELRGIAKCAPNDVFNVHIGKAIAVRRALGLEIPQEYVSAPQPTEPQVGDYVEYGGYVVKVEPSEGVYLYTSGSCAVGSYVARNGRILDDSRDGRYGEVYSV
ncbi:hypothetical protein M5X06_12790 [Paenibacillus alvei]|uniref:Uncharacterized protein n=1 Tax=Paenibacillus alvei TaxID=44250 RepID=A0ABT4GUN3_PAEAL|nr:hypothetical protein [Paenibacillus alvei]MCY9760397.1 hypothetical protein [Paenibacillus alvei]MCY9767689.1 hypothetical protein [Paenibacillus alvei]